jgi:hypothetical protein
MSDQSPVHLSSGLPETVLPPAPDVIADALAAADDDRAAVAAVVAAHPRSLDAWARLGALGRDDVERYAAYRVGYHRGLDTLRANGWRGSGYVRSSHASNLAFLSCLAGLRDMAAAIGEHDEVERITMFLQQLDP